MLPDDLSPPPAPRRTGLSKSRITLFEQCPKRLWLSVHRAELSDETAATRAGFAAGHEVGALACSLYPDGIMIEATAGLADAAAMTAKLLTTGWDRPIFEATFIHEDVLIRADLLLPVAGGWHVAEVKASTGLKAYHLGDIATQLWVIRQNGVPIVSASIRHIDRNFVLAGEHDYAGLFADSFVDDAVAGLIADRPHVAAAARAVLVGAEPERDMGAHCDKPFACSFKSWCGRDRPTEPEWPITLLPDAAGKAVARTLATEGVSDLLEVGPDRMPTPKLARVHSATVSGIAHVDRAAIRAETQGWTYPRTFLDFETIQFPVPRWLGTRPYEQIPFQFSAHVIDANRHRTHHAYLSIDGSDPRRGCAEALAALPDVGAVITWNASFERGCLLALAALYPDLADTLRSLADRIVDLLPVVRRHYYHRDMRGSWSIKAVLPTLAPELAYVGLDEVRSGNDAQAAYLEAVHPDTPDDRRANIRASMLAYCARDTEAMIAVLEQLCDLPAIVEAEGLWNRL